MKFDKFVGLLNDAIAASSDNYTLDEVFARIKAQHATIFAGESAVLICELVRQNDVLIGHGWLGAGDMDELIRKLRPQAEAWAKSNGAVAITIDGRSGWQRPLKSHGYGVDSVTLRKEIQHV